MCLRRPEEGVGSFGDKVTGECEVSDMDAENSTWIFSKSSLNSSLPSHLSSPSHLFFFFLFSFLDFICVSVLLHICVCLASLCLVLTEVRNGS